MKILKRMQASTIFALFLAVGLAAGCSDGKTGHWISGGTDNTAPTVTAVVPLNNATLVAINTRITAVFSEAMAPSTIDNSTFTVVRTVGGAAVAGTVTYAASNRTATFVPTDNLAVDNQYTATITTGATDVAGNALAAAYVWRFTTRATADTTRPLVMVTVPDNAATGVLINSRITATFNETMDPATIDNTHFTLVNTSLGGTVVPGSVTYAVIAKTATFAPTDNLANDNQYTARITTGATDLAGNALAGNPALLPAASDYVWSFMTGSAVDNTRPLVILRVPDNGAIDVPINSTVNATFNKAMDPTTIDNTTFTVRENTLPLGPVLEGPITYDVPDNIVTFSPTDNLLSNAEYVARITTGVTDLAGNALANDNVWTFTTGGTAGLAPVDLRSLSTFVAVAGAGLTNSNSSGITTLNGDVGLYPTGTCLGDGSPCTPTNPVINGTLYANDPGGVAMQAKTDLTAAYVDAMARPPGTVVNDISGMVLPPGVYTSGSTMSIAVGGTVTLDGQGDGNAVWIFQIGSSLTVNNSAQVLLINGAKAKNVFWAAFASSTLGSNVDFKGNVLAGASNSVGTDSVVLGRLLCTTGQITLLSNTITLP